MKDRRELFERLRSLSKRLAAADDRALIIEAMDAIPIERTPQRVIAERLVAAGIDAVTELVLPARSAASRSGTFRVDIAVSRFGTVVALCECKSNSRVLRGRQHENYERSGIPYVVAGHDNIEFAVAWLTKKGMGE